MIKFKITKDPNANSFGSTEIITNEINQAAKEIDLYDENGFEILYDCFCQSYGRNPNAFMSPYEMCFPTFILNNAFPKPIIGLSKNNIVFAALSGYPTKLLNYSSLGVNRKNWPQTEKLYKKDKFVFLSIDESTSRSGWDILIPAFGEQFKGQKNVVLYLKDRLATDKFKTWVKEQSLKYDISIEHDDRNIENFEEQVKIYASADVAISVNRSASFGMTILQGISCCVPTICHQYNGFADYTTSLTVNSLDYDIVNLKQEKIDYLVSIGLKNHLFSPNSNYYNVTPFWSEVRKESLKLKMQEMLDDSKLRDKYAGLGNMVADWFSWGRCVTNLSYILESYK